MPGDSIQEQIVTNLRYSRLGSENLRRSGRGASLPMLLFKPLGKFVETYFIKRGFMDGLPGLIISVNAAHSMFLKYAYLCEARILVESDTDSIDKAQASPVEAEGL